MVSERRSYSLGEVATRFLAGLSPEKRERDRQEVTRFARWCGWERPIIGLTIREVANYAEQTPSSVDPIRKLEPVKAFLAQAQKEGWIKTNLALHLRARKSSVKSGVVDKEYALGLYRLTAQGYADLKSELDSLKAKRPRVADELRKARADKDFKENAPLDAMREYQGQMEARITELEALLRSATIVEHKQGISFKVEIGSTVGLHDLDSGEELRYTLVNPGEVAPAKGKISIASPTGKALLGRREDEVIEVSAPGGKLRYRIEKIDR